MPEKQLVRPRRTGRPIESGRHVLLFAVDNVDSVFEFDPLNGRKFACLVAMDATAVSIDGIARLCRRLLDLGCVYFSAWGAGCELVHDVMDEVFVGEAEDCENRSLMTTWHDTESIGEALAFFLAATSAEFGGPDGAVILSIGCEANAQLIEDTVWPNEDGA